ncbi:amino acid transporter [Deinococcus sp.]|uniref:amino acid transporter n=1 Tax=Deinococcus sp. TaxID=47478 RepID=UPI003C79E36B
MTSPSSSPEPRSSAFRRWLLEGTAPAANLARDQEGPYIEDRGAQAQHQSHSWWKVMCLTGVDYFSSLGYAPGIAVLAAGALSPIATLVLVLLTLFGALPVYRRVAAESPHGEGSIAMLERLLPKWTGKLFVLALLGFAATDFTITITLSASDAAAHIVQNPVAAPYLTGGNIWLTLLLVAALGGVFLKGFKEAVGIAVVLVALYLGLNAALMIRGAAEVLARPEVWGQWRTALFTNHSNVFALIGISLLVFPKLALGMSGFETGVAVMPLVQGRLGDTAEKPTGRIRGTRRLLLTAALIMSSFLMLSSLICTLLIPAQAFLDGGEANGRALAYLAHKYLGEAFGSAYDISTIAILWFAGASAMAGLLNLVPRFLPRYGMAPDWSRATRPLVLVFSLISFLIVLVFRANVDAQGGAYATGVLVLMTSAAVAVTVAVLRGSPSSRPLVIGFGVIAAVFVYTTITNMVERPEGLLIALLFIAAILAVSVASRVLRSFELRVSSVELDPSAITLLKEFPIRPLRFVAHDPDSSTPAEYRRKELRARQMAHLPDADPFLFLEVQIDDASEFSDVVEVSGHQVGDYRILRARGSSVPNTIAALLLHLRGKGTPPQVYFQWSENGPMAAALDFLVAGEGDVPPLTHEILRRVEPDRDRRPIVHVGG